MAIHGFSRFQKSSYKRLKCLKMQQLRLRQVAQPRYRGRLLTVEDIKVSWGEARGARIELGSASNAAAVICPTDSERDFDGTPPLFRSGF